MSICSYLYNYLFQSVLFIFLFLSLSLSLSFSLSIYIHAHTHTHTYIYIYIYISSYLSFYFKLYSSSSIIWFDSIKFHKTTYHLVCHLFSLVCQNENSLLDIDLSVCLSVSLSLYIYIYIYGEMVDLGEFDKIMKISGKVDKSNTYNEFSSNFSSFFQWRTSSD